MRPADSMTRCVVPWCTTTSPPPSRVMDLNDATGMAVPAADREGMERRPQAAMSKAADFIGSRGPGMAPPSWKGPGWLRSLGWDTVEEGWTRLVGGRERAKCELPLP